MQFNRKRHLILKKLIEKRNTNIDIRNSRIQADEIGLSFDEIDSILKVNNVERELILSELYKNNEIISFCLSENGCFANDNGVASFANKKYLKKNEDIVIDFFKNFVQIVIPFLALLIAYISLTTKMDSLKTLSDKELQGVEKSMQKQKEHIELLEYKIEILTNHKKNDSL